MNLTIRLSLAQLAALIEAATDQAAIYRDSEDADPSLRLQQKARSLEAAAKRLSEAKASA